VAKKKKILSIIIIVITIHTQIQLSATMINTSFIKKYQIQTKVSFLCDIKNENNYQLTSKVGIRSQL